MACGGASAPERPDDRPRAGRPAARLGREWHYDHSRLDTHDTLTDVYKHRRTPAEIRALLEGLGARDVAVAEGGNGVEARCTKPAA